MDGKIIFYLYYCLMEFIITCEIWIANWSGNGFSSGPLYFSPKFMITCQNAVLVHYCSNVHF